MKTEQTQGTVNFYNLLEEIKMSVGLRDIELRDLFALAIVANKEWVAADLLQSQDMTYMLADHILSGRERTRAFITNQEEQNEQQTQDEL